MRIHYYLWLGIVLIIASCATSKDSQEKSYQPLDNALLWKISGNGLEDDSYLFGTIHLIEAEKYFLPQGTLNALESVDKVVFEIDVSEMEDMSNIMALMGKAMLPVGTTLEDLVSQDDYNLIHEHFSDLGLPKFMVDQIKPMFLSFLAGDLDFGDMSDGEMVSYEFKLQEIATANGKKIGGLETIDYQMSVFDSIPYEEQAQMLVDAVKMGNDQSDMLDELTALYQDQNIEALASAIGEEGSDRMEYILLTKRNKDWIPRIQAASEEMPILYAVGAGHLAGPNGVIHLLRLAGFTVTPILQS